MRASGLLPIIAMALACRTEAPAPPDLDHLPVVELVGWTHPRAWHVVFVGDGFTTDELPAYRELVAGYVRGLREHAAGLVAIAPDMFAFHRIDLATDIWALGTHLDRSQSCWEPLVATDPALVGRAVGAVTEDAVVVVVAHSAEGRANAAPHAIHVTDRDDWRVVQHELSHALFGLADEYVEMRRCSSRTPRDEAHVLSIANLTTLPHAAKWGGLADATGAGGARWPCLWHPGQRCILGDDGADAYCDVCRSAIDHAIRARRCEPDAEPPRAAFVGGDLTTTVVRSGQSIDLEVAAWDRQSAVRSRVLLDGVPLTPYGAPWHELDLDVVLPGTHVLVAEAIDDAGLVGTSAPRNLTITRTVSLEPEISSVTATAQPDGWIRLTIDAAPVGGELEIERDGWTGRVPIVGEESIETLVPSSDREAVARVVARTARARSSPTSSVVMPATFPTVAAPTIESVTVAGQPVEALAAVDPSLDLEVRVASCAPLARVEVAAADGTVLGRRDIEARPGCFHVAPVPVAARPGPVDVIAIDRFGRRTTRSITLPIALDAEATCGLGPRVHEGVVGLARPGSIALASAGRQVVAATATTDREGLASFPTTLDDGRRGLLLSAVELVRAAGRSIDAVDSEVRVTVVGTCALPAVGTVLVAATRAVMLRVDASPPTLRVHRFRRGTEPLTVDARDGGGHRIEVTGAGDHVTVRAIDEAGNVAREDVDVVTFRDERAGCP